MTMPAAPSRVRVGVGATIVLLLVGLAVAVLVAALGSGGQTATVSAPAASPGSAAAESSSADPDATDPSSTDTASTDAVVFVHLLGAVAKPGLYELRVGARAVDAVAAAGGFTETADQAALNLARPLSDGEQIYVPAIGEVPPGGAAAGGAGRPGSPGGAGSAGGVPGTVNLNTADAAELDTLPGVGPATAASILEWREANGRFTAVEDLLSVGGIGEKTLAALRDLVSV